MRDNSIRLGVNIDHVATLRNARGTITPSPFEAAKIVKKSGADQITIHLREDRRHIRDIDAINIINNINLDVNLEIAITDEMINFAIKYHPKFVCLVPENRQEVTTEGGLNLNLKNLINAIKELEKNQIKVSLFIDPTVENIIKSKELGVDYVELHTGKFANSSIDDGNNELLLIKDCAKMCKKLNINCNAGHGLNYENVSSIARIKEINELNIGHSLISNSIFDGLENSIRKMIILINDCRKF